MLAFPLVNALDESVHRRRSTLADFTVSCIIPTHGRPDFLREALDSVLSQTLLPAEILVVSDDGNEESAAVEAATPLGRWGGEEEIVKAVAFLITSDFVTGETIRVDGGRHVR